MGTNYYAVKKMNHCECCNRSDDITIHIGKKSWGWAFSFHGCERTDHMSPSEDGYVPTDLLSWRTWKEFLQPENGWIIVNEYHDEVPLGEFVGIVEKYGAPDYVREDGHKNLVHNEAIRNDLKYMQYKSDHDAYHNPMKHWEDEFGYSFSDEEFS